MVFMRLNLDPSLSEQDRDKAMREFSRELRERYSDCRYCGWLNPTSNGFCNAVCQNAHSLDLPKYGYSFLWSTHDGGYVARVFELPMIVAVAPTPKLAWDGVVCMATTLAKWRRAQSSTVPPAS